MRETDRREARIATQRDIRGVRIPWDLESGTDHHLAQTVGVVGFPNVCQNSFINPLKSSKGCAIAAQPVHTKELQTVRLERGIKIMDSPVSLGVVFGEDEHFTKHRSTSDRQRVKIYNLPDFSTTLELLAMLALGYQHTKLCEPPYHSPIRKNAISSCPSVTELSKSPFPIQPPFRRSPVPFGLQPITSLDASAPSVGYHFMTSRSSVHLIQLLHKPNSFASTRSFGSINSFTPLSLRPPR
ncbi:hypothetical protein BS17DRAFT_816883 [Gyrodon lividus]|nr:hypothetical protein BS17DRAFT_816883 [Gyrodon lividus]